MTNSKKTETMQEDLQNSIQNDEWVFIYWN
jgi:hypothetical protein